VGERLSVEDLFPSPGQWWVRALEVCLELTVEALYGQLLPGGASRDCWKRDLGPGLEHPKGVSFL